LPVSRVERMTGRMPLLLSFAAPDKFTHLSRSKCGRRDYVTEFTKQSTKISVQRFADAQPMFLSISRLHFVQFF